MHSAFQRVADFDVCIVITALCVLHVQFARVDQARSIYYCTARIRSETVRFVHIRVTVVIGVDRVVRCAVIRDCSCDFACVCVIRAFECVLQAARTRETLDLGLVDSYVVGVFVDNVERAVESRKLLAECKVSVFTAREVVEFLLDKHVLTVDIGVYDALIFRIIRRAERVSSVFRDLFENGVGTHKSVFRTIIYVARFVECVSAVFYGLYVVSAVGLCRQCITAVCFGVVVVAVCASIKFDIVFLIEVSAVIIVVIRIGIVTIEVGVIEDVIRALLTCEDIFFSAEFD